MATTPALRATGVEESMASRPLPAFVTDGAVDEREEESKQTTVPKSKTVIPPTPSNTICRNRHWRYISSFHGPWVQVTIDSSELLAHVNYNSPRPRPIDPGVFFDIMKIRRLVDEADNLAVRAADDTATSTLTNVHGGRQGASPRALASGNGKTNQGQKLSRERRFRMREQASQKLARAYRLDDVACSVATMQGSTPLDEIGSLVLERLPKDPDATYVHFFHEKIPTSGMAQSTEVQPLTDILMAKPGEPEVLRTRATVKMSKLDFEGAIQDLTNALSLCRVHGAQDPSKTPGGRRLEPPEVQGSKRRPADITLPEKDQPTGLEGQLLLQRAVTYLTMSWRAVEGGLIQPEVPIESLAKLLGSAASSVSPAIDSPASSPSKLERKNQAETRKLVRTYAKRAVKGYLAFFSTLEYAPNQPSCIQQDFNERVSLVVYGDRLPRITHHTAESLEPFSIYTVADLFTDVPPADLPPYPPPSPLKKSAAALQEAPTCEWVTYHPLLVDALHQFLMAHALAQTPAKTIQRHAYNVARLTRIADGFPCFSSILSASREDWELVIRCNPSWIDLSKSWTALCKPMSPYGRPLLQAGNPQGADRVAAANTLINGDAAQTAVSAPPRNMALPRLNAPGKVTEQALMIPVDETMTDEASIRAALSAEEKKLKAGHRTARAGGARSGSGSGSGSSAAQPEESGVADLGETLRMSHRAAWISRWIQDAPAVRHIPKGKKGDKKGKQEVDGMAKLSLEGSAAA